MKMEINLDKAVKEAVEKIVARGCLEEEWERILISTASELCDLLFNPIMDGEGAKRARALQHEVGFFLPSLTEAIFGWVKEDKVEVIDGIRSLGTYHIGNSCGNSNLNSTTTSPNGGSAS